MKTTFKAIIGSMSAVLMLFMSGIDYDMTAKSIIHPQVFNAVSFILGVAMSAYALKMILIWNEEEDEI